MLQQDLRTCVTRTVCYGYTNVSRPQEHVTNSLHRNAMLTSFLRDRSGTVILCFPGHAASMSTVFEHETCRLTDAVLLPYSG